MNEEDSKYAPEALVEVDRGVFVPAKHIAESRADYYACKVDGHEKGSEEWNSEFEFSLDKFELMNWYRNSMDFEDVREFAIITGTEGEPTTEEKKKFANYDVDNIFQYHAPNQKQVEKYSAIRDNAKTLAKVIIELCPESPEGTLALRHVEYAVMMANAAIARRS